MKFLASFVYLTAVVYSGSALPVQDDDFVWMNSGKFEGDMVLDADQALAVLGLGSKNGLVNQKYRWPNNTVPYVIVGGYFNQDQIDHIHKVVKEFEKVSCVTVRPKERTDTKYVQITGKGKGCYSSVGFYNGVQTLNLAPHRVEKGCFKKSAILHEFLHTLGFYHQQSTHDRDDYLTIMWDNIKPGSEGNLKKLSPNLVQNFGTPYDYLSLMHYGAYAYSKNGQKTMVTKDPEMSDVIGKAKKMSDIDIKKLNAMYCQ